MSDGRKTARVTWDSQSYGSEKWTAYAICANGNRVMAESYHAEDFVSLYVRTNGQLNVWTRAATGTDEEMESLVLGGVDKDAAVKAFLKVSLGRLAD